MQFVVKREVLNIGLKAITITITNVDNQNQNPEFTAFKTKAYQALKEKYQNFDIETDLILRGFNKLHKKIGIKRRKNTPISENILKRFLKDDALIHQNKLMELYNIVSLDSRLSLGIYDMDKIDGDVTLEIAKKNDAYIAFNGEQRMTNGGEYIYKDAKDIICYLEVAPCKKAIVSENTKNIFITIEGNEDTSAEYLMEVTDEIIYLITSYCGGKAQIIYK